MSRTSNPKGGLNRSMRRFAVTNSAVPSGPYMARGLLLPCMDMVCISPGSPRQWSPCRCDTNMAVSLFQPRPALAKAACAPSPTSKTSRPPSLSMHTQGRPRDVVGIAAAVPRNMILAIYGIPYRALYSWSWGRRAAQARCRPAPILEAAPAAGGPAVRPFGMRRTERSDIRSQDRTSYTVPKPRHGCTIQLIPNK